MTSTIQAVGRVLRGGGNPKSVPELTSPGLIFRANCTYLGKHSGRDWYLSPDGLELEVVGARIDPNDPAVATARYFKEPQAGGGYRLQEVKAYVVGAFAARTSVKPKVPRPTAPSRPVDALDAVSVFTGKGTRFTDSFRNRGAEGLVAKLSRRGVELHLSADRSGLVVTGAGGRAARGTALTPYIAAAEVARPLLLPYLRDGKPPACAVSSHPEPVEAVTVAGGAPALAWCGRCAGGAA